MSSSESRDDLEVINSLINQLQKLTNQFSADEKPAGAGKISAEIWALNKKPFETVRGNTSHPKERKLSDSDTYLESIEPLLLQVIEAEIAERASRSRFLPERYFSEPAWDIMLDLYVQLSRGKRVSVTSACIATNAPLSTALRWVNALIEDGFVKRTESRSDRRRAWLELTDIGASKVAAYAEAAAAKRGMLHFIKDDKKTANNALLFS